MQDSPPRESRQLDRLFGSAERFVDAYEAACFLQHRTEGFDDLFGIAVADRLIGAGVLRVPFDARMANKVGGTTEETAHRWREAMRGTSATAFDPDVAVAGFDTDDTIVLHGLHRRVPSLDRFAFELEREVGQMIDVNAFLTPPNAQGLDAHYDHHDVIILQVAGAKHWRLWRSNIEHPLPEYAPEQFEVRGEPTDVLLEPGDVLYVPRGWTHAATTTDRTSLHLTVGIIPMPWLEVAHSFLASLDADPSLRRALPLGHHRDPSRLEEPLEAVVRDVARTIRSTDVEVAAKELAASVRSQRATRVGRLGEVVAANDPLHPDDRLVLGSCAGDLLRRDGDRWFVVLGGSPLPLPASFERGIAAIVCGDTIELDGLIDASDESAVRVVRQLLRHGVLAKLDLIVDTTENGPHR